MSFRNALRQRLVHPDDNGPNLRDRGIRVQHFLEPRQLIGIELIWGGVVEGYKVDPIFDPVVVSPQFEILAVVVEPLLAQDRRIDPIGELQQVLFARFWRDYLVVSDRKKHGQGAEGKKLILYKVVPGKIFVADDVQRFPDVRGLMLDIFVEIVNRAEVAQMPVKAGAIFPHTGGDGRHNDVPAVA